MTTRYAIVAYDDYYYPSGIAGSLPPQMYVQSENGVLANDGLNYYSTPSIFYYDTGTSLWEATSVGLLLDGNYYDKGIIAYDSGTYVYHSDGILDNAGTWNLYGILKSSGEFAEHGILDDTGSFSDYGMVDVDGNVYSTGIVGNGGSYYSYGVISYYGDAYSEGIIDTAGNYYSDGLYLSGVNQLTTGIWDGTYHQYGFLDVNGQISGGTGNASGLFVYDSNAGGSVYAGFTGILYQNGGYGDPIYASNGILDGSGNYNEEGILDGGYYYPNGIYDDAEGNRKGTGIWIDGDGYHANGIMYDNGGTPTYQAEGIFADGFYYPNGIYDDADGSQKGSGIWAADGYHSNGILQSGEYAATGIFNGSYYTDGVLFPDQSYDSISNVTEGAAAAQLATDTAEVTANVTSINDDTTILGVTGTQNIAAIESAAAAAQLVIDTAAVEAEKENILVGINILGVSGEYVCPDTRRFRIASMAANTMNTKSGASGLSANTDAR